MADITLTPAADGGLATAMYSDDIRTCVRHEAGSKADYYRQVCYNAWDEVMESCLDDDSTAEITAEVVAATAGATLAKVRSGQRGKVSLTRAEVETWLSDPDRYSPWMDLIAIERAAQFDWDVIDNLTRHEYAALCARLNEESFNVRASNPMSYGTSPLGGREARYWDSTPEQRARLVLGRRRHREARTAA